MTIKESWRISSTGQISRRKYIRYPNGDVYEGDVLNGKWNGLGTFTSSSSDRKYKGAFKDGYFHGYGIDCMGRCKYEGFFDQGKRCGRGTFIDASGDEWNGTYVNDSVTGPGQVKKANGDKLIGEFKNGKLECKASIIEYQNGDRYEGPCHGGKMYGTGKYTFEGSQAFYEGFYVRGLKHGKGTFRYLDGSIYKGDFDEDVIKGYGIIEYSILRSPLKSYEGQWDNGQYSDGKVLYDAYYYLNSYTGCFASGEFDGFGKLIYRDGGFYEGSFKMGKKNGYGTRLWSTGNSFVGTWDDDEMVMGIHTNPSQSSYYVGSFVNGRKSGQGREIWNLAGKQKSKDSLLSWLFKCDGLYMYEGEYKNSNFDGSGRLFAPCGRKYEGNWKLGRPSGFGKATLLSNGEQSLYRPYKYIGEWYDGRRHGQGALYYLDESTKSGLFEFGKLKDS